MSLGFRSSTYLQDCDQVDSFFETKDKKKQRSIVFGFYNKGRLDVFNKLCYVAMKKKEDANKKYYYMITFTLRSDVTEDNNKIENYIIQRLKCFALRIEKCHLVKEYTKKKVAHWHASVISKGYISKDRFNLYQNKYGNVDISKNHSHQYENMIKYMSKSDTPKLIVDVELS